MSSSLCYTLVTKHPVAQKEWKHPIADQEKGDVEKSKEGGEMLAMEFFAINLITKFLGIVLVMLSVQTRTTLAASVASSFAIAGIFLIFSTLIIKAIYQTFRVKQGVCEKRYFSMLIPAAAACYMFYKIMLENGIG